ncbi:MAG: hypothetical protein FIB01_12870 [Gemmatimonadetes bacterium]|nr:hypothetical protein [Gemmatimonadota bacterium]
MAHHASHSELPLARLHRLPTALRAASPALIGLGGIGLVAAVLLDPDRGWRAYLVNWLFFMSVAQGALLLAAVVSITKGLWSRPIRRFALSFVGFLPIAYLAMVPLFIAADHIFPWIAAPIPGKDAWLNVPFLTARNLILFGILVALDLAFAYYALRPDLGLIRDQVPASLRDFYQRLTGQWLGQEAEELRSHRRLLVLGPALVVAYALAMGLIAWDFVMSLEPHWFSTLIGPYFFMGAFLGGVMATALLTLLYRDQLELEHWILPSTLHDLGKLGFGFTVFWGYLFFSQYIVIWYGLLPIEQAFVIHRFTEPFKYVAQAVGLLLFVIPFFGLLGVVTKRRPRLLATLASTSLVGLYLERYLLVYPSLWIGTERLPIGWQEPAIALFFAGLLLLALGWFAHRFPLMQLWQPPSEIELQGVERELAPDEAVPER